MLLGYDNAFWISVLGATVIKLAASNHEGSVRTIIIKGAAQAFTAVFVAMTFTEPLIAWLAVDPETYKIPVAVLLALTGESLVRLVTNIVPDDPKTLIEWYRVWRGK